MAKSAAPSHDSTKSVVELHASHQGHRITRVGAVSVDQTKGGGTFTVYYCQNDDVLFSDIKS